MKNTGVPGPKDNPSYQYWSTERKKRTRLSDEELAELNKGVEKYYRERFVAGRRFELTRDYCGIPKGTKATVVSEWPRAAVRWDKWSKKGYGALRRMSDMGFELDVALKYIDKVDH